MKIYLNKIILVTATVLGLAAVILGAFASHGLKGSISVESLQTFDTGVRYQMYHAIILLFVGMTSIFTLKTKRILYSLMLTGILFFSGSIYGLATNVLTSFDFKNIGFVTPIGGALLIISWAVMLIGFLKLKIEK